MRKLSFIILSLFLLNSCDDSSTDTNDPINNPGGTEISKDGPSLSLVKEGIVVGLYPNRIVADSNYVYVVNSGDNTVGRLDLNNHVYDNNFIKFPQGTSPYSIALKYDSEYNEDLDDIIPKETLYISTSGRLDTSYIPDDAIFEVSLDTKEVKEIKSGLFMASDIIVTDTGCLVYVESEYDYANSKAEGKLTRLCKNEETSIPTSCKNPTRVATNDPMFIVTCSGIFTYDDSYSITGTPGAGACIYNRYLEETKCFNQDGDTGSPAVYTDKAVVGSTYSGTLTVIDGPLLNTYTPFDTPSMLVPYHLYDDIYAIAAFNTSTLYLYDLVNNKLVSEYKMSGSELDKKGPLDLIYIEDRSQLVVLNSLSSTIDIFSVNKE